MSCHDALGLSSGTRGEHDVREVVGAHPIGTSLGFGRRFVGTAIQEFRPADSASGNRGFAQRNVNNMLRQAVSMLVQKLPAVIGAEELAGYDDGRRRGAFDDLDGLTGGVPGIERNQHRSRVVRAEGRDRPVMTVGCPDGHPVTGADA